MFAKVRWCGRCLCLRIHAPATKALRSMQDGGESEAKKPPESSVDVDNQFNQLSNVASLAQCDWNRNKCHWMDDVKDDSLQR